MRVLLINPASPDTFWGYRHALRFVGRKALLPPLGLLTIAAMLPPEWELRLIDMNVRPLTQQDLAWADAAWISAMTVQEQSAREVIARCAAQGVRTVAGGPLFSCDPDAFSGVDHLVLGEAETTLPPFLRDLALGQPQRRYQSADKPALTHSPVPRYDLVRPRDYHALSVQFSRGCPFDCDFCNVTSMLGKTPRTKTPDQLIRELDAIARTGFHGGVFFVDDNLIGSKHAIRTLLPPLQRWHEAHPRIRFFTQASINLADDAKLTADLVSAGFDTVFVGIETPDAEALASCHKRQNLKRDLVANVRKLHHAGLQVQAGFILGFDTDTPLSFTRLVEFIRDSGIITAMVGILQAPTGTRLYERMRHEGRLLGRFTGNNVAAQTNIQTRLSPTTLHDGYRRVMHDLYNAKDFRRRLKTFLRDYRLPSASANLQPAQVWTFLKASVSLGLLKHGRSHYWRLLAWTATHRPRHLPLAVRLWVEGHHFRTICRQQLGSA